MNTDTTAFALMMIRKAVRATGARVARIVEARCSAFLLSLFVLALPGCAVHDALVESDLRSISVEHAKSLERVKAAVAGVMPENLSDSSIHERWGVLAKLADTNWRDYHVTEGSSMATFEWIYPGVLLEYRRQHHLYRSPNVFILFWYDPGSHRIVADDLMLVQDGKWAKPDAYPVQLVDDRTFRFLKPDGSPAQESFELSEDGSRYLAKREGFASRRHEGEFRTPAQARQTLDSWAETRREKAWQRSKAQEDLFAAMLTGLQTTADYQKEKGRADVAASFTPATSPARVEPSNRSSTAQAPSRTSSVSASTAGQPLKQAPTRPADAPTSTNNSGSRQALLTFLYQVPMEYRQGDTNNSNCWVLVSVPGPAGFLESNDRTQVLSVVDAYKSRALQKCGTLDRRVKGDPSAGYVDDMPSKLGQARAQYDRQAGQNAQYRFELH
jgi:hypothetical protein